MSKSARRVFSRKFKLSAVNRMLKGENVSELAREPQVLRKDLYVWRDHFRAGGPIVMLPLHVARSEISSRKFTIVNDRRYCR